MLFITVMHTWKRNLHFLIRKTSKTSKSLLVYFLKLFLCDTKNFWINFISEDKLTFASKNVLNLQNIWKIRIIVLSNNFTDRDNYQLTAFIFSSGSTSNNFLSNPVFRGCLEKTSIPLEYTKQDTHINIIAFIISILL